MYSRRRSKVYSTQRFGRGLIASHTQVLASQTKGEQLAGLALVAAFIQLEPNTSLETNFELIQTLTAVFPPALCDFDVQEEAVRIFGL